MDTLCSDVLKIIFTKLNMVDISRLSQVSTKFNQIVNQILTEKLCVELYMKYHGTPMIRKPTDLTWRRFWYFVETNTIKPVTVNRKIKIWVDRTVTFQSLGLKSDFEHAIHVEIGRKLKNKEDFHLDTPLFQHLIGKTNNSIVYDLNSRYIKILGY